MLREGRVVTKQQIVDHLYGWEDASTSNAIEVFVYRLRKKLEPRACDIRTVRGMGYLIEKPHAQPERRCCAAQLLRLAARSRCSLLLVTDAFVSYWIALSFSQRAYDRALRRDRARGLAASATAQTAALELELPEAARKLLFTDPGRPDLLRGRRPPTDARVAGDGDRAAAASGAEPRRAGDVSTTATLDGAPVRIVELAVPAAADAPGRPRFVQGRRDEEQAQRARARDPAERGRAAGAPDPDRRRRGVGRRGARAVAAASACSAPSLSRSHRDCSPIVVARRAGRGAPAAAIDQRVAGAAGRARSRCRAASSPMRRTS